MHAETEKWPSLYNSEKPLWNNGAESDLKSRRKTSNQKEEVAWKNV